MNRLLTQVSAGLLGKSHGLQSAEYVVSQVHLVLVYCDVWRRALRFDLLGLYKGAD